MKILIALLLSVSIWGSDTNQLKYSYDMTKFVAVTFDSKTNLFIDGVNMKRFLELSKEFQNPPSPYIPTQNQIVLKGNGQPGPSYYAPVYPQGQNPFTLESYPRSNTPEDLRRRADEMENQQRQFEIQENIKKTESDSRMKRWEEYLGMLAKLEETCGK